jgi:hypothetical protein
MQPEKMGIYSNTLYTIADVFKENLNGPGPFKCKPPPPVSVATLQRQNAENVLLEEICRLILGIYKSLKDT